MTSTGLLDPDSRRRVNELFHEALELPPADRADFVRRSCPGAVAIANEVLGLLEAHEQAGQFLAAPVSSAARNLIDAAAAAAQRVGRQIGQYRIDRVLGHGGMGVVYQATDLRLGRVVALKAVAPAVAGDAARRERLRREARAAASLTHAGIATVYALEEFDDDLFIAGEFVPGETLREEVQAGPADPARLLQTAIELAEALGSAHDAGVVHRDLKPENVIRMPSGHVKILDFGLARMRNMPVNTPTLTVDGAIFGTPAYMSPEQIRHETIDARSDLFSLGIVLYELLTGIHPFGGADAAETIASILEREPRPFRGSRDLPPASGQVLARLETIIRTLLRKVPAARFATARDLLAALQRVQSGQLPAAAHLAASGGDETALRWWKFHQTSTCVFYALMLIPIWLARRTLGNEFGLSMFLVAVGAVVGAITLRTHLWFAATSMPEQFDHQHRSSKRWVRTADLVFVAAAITAAIALLVWNRNSSDVNGKSVDTVILFVGGVIALIAATVIEPATSRAAFGQRSGD